jgi:uncharacterized protein (DUF1501 family)
VVFVIQNQGISRRKFLKKSSQYSLATAAAANSVGMLGLLNASGVMADPNDPNDYKALVFIILSGGNDCFNMIVPTGSGALRSNYELGRGIVALPEAGLHSLNLVSPARVHEGADSAEFAMHPSCSAMSELFNNQHLAVICNTGNLVMPLTREQYFSGVADLPPQLYSHTDQERQLQSEPTNPFRYGWGGRMAEMLTPYNTDNQVSPLISVSGLNSFQVTRDSLINTYALGRDGVAPLYGFYGYRQAIVESSMQSTDSSSHLMAQKYRNTFDSAQLAETIMQAAFQEAESNGVDYDEIFTASGSTNSDLSRQLKTLAKMIAGRSNTNNNRPVYFVSAGGFDNHQKLLPDHNVLMADLSASLKAFKDCLAAQGDFDKVLTMVSSEFARTFTPNGNDPVESGTDHGWGGHMMVMGEMVNGGRFFGSHPNLALDEGLDTDRGRWIPTTANSQCAAIAANWMGVAESDLNGLFPTLDNFPSPFDIGENLGFINGAPMYGEAL